jgi:thiamine-phosphate pyrophosphorylase
MAVVSDAAAGLLVAQRATVLQLRAPGLSARKLEDEANQLVPSAAVPVVISSRCDVVLAAGAAGVNLPEKDIDVAGARHLVGERLVGRSVHSLESALQAEREGADYVIFGPVWASASHPTSSPVGVEALAEVSSALHIPVIAIGGVTEERIEQCLAAGADGYAAIGLFE